MLAGKRSHTGHAWWIIITLYKSKGEQIDYNSYRGIFLLYIEGNVIKCIILTRLYQLAERVYPESHCGFRSGRSTVNMIFSSLSAAAKIQRANYFIVYFIYWSHNAFDLLSRDSLFNILTKKPNMGYCTIWCECAWTF